MIPDMGVTVRLSDIVDALQADMMDYAILLDCSTGEVEAVSHYLIDLAEDSEPEPSLPEWQKPEWEIAKRIAAGDRFLNLPDKHDVHEWEIMREFSESIESEKIRAELLNAIRGSGAFRYFKDTIRRHKIQEDWYAFLEEALKQIAIEWCEENDLVWK
jgi:hypothetical protein